MCADVQNPEYLHLHGTSFKVTSALKQELSSRLSSWTPTKRRASHVSCGSSCSVAQRYQPQASNSRVGWETLATARTSKTAPPLCSGSQVYHNPNQDCICDCLYGGGSSRGRVQKRRGSPPSGFTPGAGLAFAFMVNTLLPDSSNSELLI